MEITKITIENFKSIKKLSFEIKKYGSSYTTMLLGVNESGKSNILRAMSFLNVPDEEFDYKVIRNKKDKGNNPVSIKFHLSFEQKQTYLSAVKKGVINEQLLNFEITNIIKDVYLEDGETEFSSSYSFEVSNLTDGLFIKKVQKNVVVGGQSKAMEVIELANKNDDEESYEELTLETFKEHFDAKIESTIKLYENKVSFWEPSEQYLLSEVDLNVFKEDVDSNIPLKHIFYISGYEDEDEIKQQINNISDISLRRELAGTLGKQATEYVKKIWKHKIIIDIEITDAGMCNVSVKDEGKKNEFNYHKMNVRSEGFKQFMSLILSLSIEAKVGAKNKLILIDEPESHLHPSGIRDLREELLEIGKNNYLFVSTHSPFLVDKKNKERNIVIKKNPDALTEKKEISSLDDIRSDEVLDIAFGINVYKDLLTPHRILVEGSSDKVILEKAFGLLDYEYGITNGTGSNIVQIASKLNHDDISVLVVLDDDESGRECKEKILAIKGVYNAQNVLTIRDLANAIKNNGTIEDVLSKDFVESKFKELYNAQFGEESTIVMDDTPYINQIKAHLQREGKYSDDILIKLKTKLSDEFNPNKTSLDRDFPLLKSLVEAIHSNLES